MMNLNNTKVNGSKISFVVMLLFLFGQFSIAQVNWITFEEAEANHKTESRKIFVDVYTDWCGWCKKMDASTFQEDEVSAYLNDNYYAIKFNAEQKEDITFKGKTYKYVKYGKRGYHELALEILKGKLSYPSVVFIDEELNVIQSIEGYKGPSTFKMIMTYFGRDFHKSIPWRSYIKTYDPVEALGSIRPQTVKNKN